MYKHSSEQWFHKSSCEKTGHVCTNYTCLDNIYYYILYYYILLLYTTIIYTPIGMEGGSGCHEVVGSSDSNFLCLDGIITGCFELHISQTVANSWPVSPPSRV